MQISPKSQKQTPAPVNREGKKTPPLCSLMIKSTRWKETSLPRNNACYRVHQKKRNEEIIVPFILQPRINLIHNILPRPRAPVPTRLGHDTRDGHIVADLVGALQHIQIQTLGDVPCDVAVERPDAG